MKVSYSFSCAAAFLSLLAPPLAAAPSLVLSDSHGISGFELYGNGIYWWAGPGRCVGEFPFDASIRLRGTLLSATKNLATDCAIHQGEIYNTVRDGSYFYFFRQGVLQRKAINAAENDPSQVMPAPGGAAVVTLPSGQRSALLELEDGNLYWAAFNSGNGFATVYRMPTDGGADPVSVFTNTGGSDIRKFEHVIYENSNGNDTDALVILTADGRLYRKVTGALLYLQLATGVADFTIHRRAAFGGSITYVYAAKGTTSLSPGTPAGSLARIDISTGTSTTLYTAAGQNQILSVAVDPTSSSLVIIGSPPRRIYILEGRVECGGLFCTVTDGSIRRNSVPGSTSGWDLIQASGAAGNLRRDDHYVYFLGFNQGLSTQVMRLPSDAPAIELRMQADAMEVVQNSQDINNSVSLVANKPTFVRAYAHLGTNTTGSAKWFPNATLRGQRNGVDLPGSPLSHINNTAIGTTSSLDTLRTNLNSSFLFELPNSWVAPGSINLTFTVNSSQGIPETGSSPNADNSITRATSFVKKDKPCLVLVPMRTTAPLYDPTAPNSGLATIIARARSLLPVEDFKIFTANQPVEKLVIHVEIEYVVCFPLVCAIPVPKISYEPFDMQSDEDWALFWLTFDHFLSSDPSGCPDTHWVGTVHPSINGFNGIGGRSDLNLQDFSTDLPSITIPDFGTSDFLVVRMEPGPGPNVWDSPMGGRTLAHELGHNYGRKHINQSSSCGGSTPDGPYQSYPFNPCTIGPLTGNSALFGFDPISRQVLPPTVGGDLMTYSTTRWISKFTWDAINNKTLTLSAPSGGSRQIRQNQDQPVFLVNGFVSLDNDLASIRPSYVLPPGTADADKVTEALDALGKVDPGYPFHLRLTDAVGTMLGEWPLLLTPATDSSSSRLGFVQFVPWNSMARRIQLWKNTTLLAEKLVSPHPPTIALSPPEILEDEHAINLSWTVSDPDQDILVYTIQYSADDGATWLSLRLNDPFTEVRLDSSMLPGSDQARLRVIACDGVNTAIDTTDALILASHPPEPVISGLRDGERIPYGSPIRLAGLALDAEDGSLDSSHLLWTVAGPVSLTNQGGSLLLSELPPGAYDIGLTGTDSDQQTGTATLRIEVRAALVPDGNGLVLDGACSDNAYVDAAFFRIPLGGGEFAGARLVHVNGRLYASFSDLPFGSAGNAAIGLRIDPDASGDDTPQPDDFGFYVDEDGIPSQRTGNGTSMPSTLTPQLGYSSAVVRGPGSWCAELCIDDGLLGGWDHASRLLLHFERAGRQPGSQWPPQTDPDTPRQWSLVFLGTPAPSTNRPPVALAGPDHQVLVPITTTVYLDGSGSHDPDGDPLVYAWTQVSGPDVILDHDDSATPAFIAEPVSMPQTLRFRLTVNDGQADGGPDEVEVMLLPAAPPPELAPVSMPGMMLSDGSFVGALSGEPEQLYEIEATTDFMDWISIGTAMSDFYGIMTLVDQDAANYPYRFYRGEKQ